MMIPVSFILVIFTCCLSLPVLPEVCKVFLDFVVVVVIGPIFPY